VDKGRIIGIQIRPEHPILQLKPDDTGDFAAALHHEKLVPTDLRRDVFLGELVLHPHHAAIELPDPRCRLR